MKIENSFQAFFFIDRVEGFFPRLAFLPAGPTRVKVPARDFVKPVRLFGIAVRLRGLNEPLASS